MLKYTTYEGLTRSTEVPREGEPKPFLTAADIERFKTLCKHELSPLIYVCCSLDAIDEILKDED
jgi:hypothetical protein